MKKLTYTLLLGTLALASCSEWLDVKPKTQVEEKELFTNEQGFKEALTGIYITMATPAMYGEEMTYGFMDVLAKRYSATDHRAETDEIQTETDYNLVQGSRLANLYTNPIWYKTYNLIANLNNLLANLQAHGEFIPNEMRRNIITGEAYGLRAYLYFDLLRMWGPIYKDKPNDPSIPYRTVFDRATAKLKPASEVADSVIADLKRAETYLKDDAMRITFPNYANDDPNVTDLFLDRRFKRMNKYAVKAELARVYMYIGDKTNAAKYAQEVIDAKKEDGTSMFKLVTNNANDPIMSTELIFALDDYVDEFKSGRGGMQSFQDYIQAMFKNGDNSAKYSVAPPSKVYEMFDTDVDGFNDMRMKDGQGFLFTSGSATCIKYYDNNYAWSIDNSVPLLRLPEMYYILAECTSSLDEAADYINTIRELRGLEAVKLENEEEREHELMKEYRKEFYAEGQLWYYYKRHGYETYLHNPVEHMTEAHYRFSIPADETALGNIN